MRHNVQYLMILLQMSWEIKLSPLANKSDTTRHVHHTHSRRIVWEYAHAQFDCISAQSPVLSAWSRFYTNPAVRDCTMKNTASKKKYVAIMYSKLPGHHAHHRHAVSTLTHGYGHA